VDGLSSPKRRWLEFFDDGGLLLLVVVAIPLVILAVGAPIGLLAWLISIVAQRF
jgi:hypothetical protein